MPTPTTKSLRDAMRTAVTSARIAHAEMQQHLDTVGAANIEAIRDAYEAWVKAGQDVTTAQAALLDRIGRDQQSSL